MLEHLIAFAEHLGPWGFLVIFLVVALACQAVVGLIMPGESLVLMGGIWDEDGCCNTDVGLVCIRRHRIKRI